MPPTPPTPINGKICYIEMPALDVRRSADFYAKVFDSVAATVDVITAQGGTLVQPIGADAPEITARFRDPAGNLIGLYQEPGH